VPYSDHHIRLLIIRYPYPSSCETSPRSPACWTRRRLRRSQENSNQAVLLGTRLYPDMFPLAVRSVRSAPCGTRVAQFVGNDAATISDRPNHHRRAQGTRHKALDFVKRRPRRPRSTAREQGHRSQIRTREMPFKGEQFWSASRCRTSFFPLRHSLNICAVSAWKSASATSWAPPRALGREQTENGRRHRFMRATATLDRRRLLQGFRTLAALGLLRAAH